MKNDTSTGFERSLRDVCTTTSFMTNSFDFESFLKEFLDYKKMCDSTLYGGLRILTDYSVGKMVQARTHKKKRINKKWRKRFGFKSVPDGDKIYVIPPAGVIVMHPGTYKKLKKAMKNCNQKEIQK